MTELLALKKMVRPVVYGGNVVGPNNTEQKLLDKIRSLPPEKAAEVEDFGDFLKERENGQQLARAATRLSEDAFQKVWDNDNDAEYDRL